MKRPRSEETASGTNGTSETEVAAEAHPTGGGRPSKRGVEPGLHLVATPIGNAADITLRALEVLRQVDVIACEDTRVSAKLMSLHGIGTRRVPYHDHKRRRDAAAADRTDAGRRPCRADLRCRHAAGFGSWLQVGLRHGRGRHPGAYCARRVGRADRAPALPRCPATGSSSPASCRPKQAARRRELAGLASVPATMIFFESAPRLASSLTDMAAELGDRPAAVARELTKLYEEVRRGPLSELAAHYAETGRPKARSSSWSAHRSRANRRKANSTRSCGRRWKAPACAMPLPWSRRHWVCRVVPSMPARSNWLARRNDPATNLSGRTKARAPRRNPVCLDAAAEGLPDPGTRLEECGRRDRHRGAARPDRRHHRGQGTRTPRDGSRVLEHPANGAGSAGPPPSLSLRDRAFSAMICAST